MAAFPTIQPPALGRLAGVIKAKRTQPEVVSYFTSTDAPIHISVDEQSQDSDSGLFPESQDFREGFANAVLDDAPPKVVTARSEDSSREQRSRGNRRRHKQRELRRNCRSVQPHLSEGMDMAEKQDCFTKDAPHHVNKTVAVEQHFGKSLRELRQRFEAGLVEALDDGFVRSSSPTEIRHLAQTLPVSPPSNLSNIIGNFSSSLIGSSSSTGSQPFIDGPPGDWCQPMESRVRLNDPSEAAHKIQDRRAKVTKPRHKKINARAIATRVRTIIKESQEAAWETLRQEFEVQQLVWNSTLVMESSGMWSIPIEPSHRPDVMLRTAITSILQLSQTDYTMATQLLAEELRKDENGDASLNKATKASMQQVIELHQLASVRSRLADLLEVRGSATVAKTNNPQIAIEELETLFECCDLANHTVSPLVRQAFGLHLVKELPLVKADERPVSVPMTKTLPCPKSSSESDSRGSYRNSGSSRRRANSGTSRQRARTRSSGRSGTSSSISSVLSLTSIREGKVLRL